MTNTADLVQRLRELQADIRRWVYESALGDEHEPSRLLRKARDELAVAADALAGLTGPEDLRAHPDFKGEWARIFGDEKRWTWLSEDARKYGKHWAANDAQVRGLLDRLKQTDPAGADTLASMIFFRQLADNREVMAWQQVDELRAEQNGLSTAPADKNSEG